MNEKYAFVTQERDKNTHSETELERPNNGGCAAMASANYAPHDDGIYVKVEDYVGGGVRRALTVQVLDDVEDRSFFDE